MIAEQERRTGTPAIEKHIDNELETWKRNVEKLLEFQTISEKVDTPIGRRIVLENFAMGGSVQKQENVGIILRNGGAEDEHVVLFVDGTMLLIEKGDQVSDLLRQEFGPNREPKVFPGQGETNKSIGRIKEQIMSQRGIKVTSELTPDIAERSFERAADVITQGLKRIETKIISTEIFNDAMAGVTSVTPSRFPGR